MEVDVNIDIGFEFGDDGGCTRRCHEAGHILEGDYLGAEGFHSLGFLNEVFVGENFLGSGSCGSFLAEQFGEEALGCFDLRRFFLGVYGVAYGTVGDAAQGVDHADGLLDVVDVVERIKDTHNIQTVGDSFFVEAFEHIVGIRHIAKKVATARQSRQHRLALHDFGDGAQTIPGRFVEIAHYRVGYGAAPYFHNVEAGILVQRQQFVNFGLAQTGGEQ